MTWHQTADYPKEHIGYEHWDWVYKLRARQPWVEFPILNRRDGRHWTEGDSVGPVRAVYNEGNRKKFDVVYHKNPGTWKFEKAVYRPARRQSTPRQSTPPAHVAAQPQLTFENYGQW